MFKRTLTLLVVVTLIFTMHSAFAKLLENKVQKKEKKVEQVDKIQARVKELSLQLYLSDKQKEKITEILTNAKQEVRKVLEEASGKIEEIQAKQEDDIASTLSDAQREKFLGTVEEDENPLKMLQ